MFMQHVHARRGRGEGKSIVTILNLRIRKLARVYQIAKKKTTSRILFRFGISKIIHHTTTDICAHFSGSIYRAKLRIFVSGPWRVEADFLLATFF